MKNNQLKTIKIRLEETRFDRLLKYLNLFVGLATMIGLVFAICSLEQVKRQINWAEREVRVDISLAGYQSYTGKFIKDNFCNDENSKCFIYPNSLSDTKNYTLANFGLMNLGERTLKDLDINLRCTSCNFSAIIYSNYAIEKRVSIHLPYSAYISLEKLPPTNSFEQTVFLVWEDGKEDSWSIQYSSYEINKRVISLIIKDNGNYIDYNV